LTTLDIDPKRSPDGGDEKIQLYKKREKVYPQAISGTFRNLKWLIMSITLGIYYLSCPSCATTAARTHRTRLCWWIWTMPAQILLLLHRNLAAGSLLPDRPVDHRRDDAVSDERSRWPHLVRLYLCPQTVWTDLFSG
jgi:hypothetical protein